MADLLSQSLTFKRREDQERLAVFIKSKAEEIQELIQKTDSEATTCFGAREKTIEEYGRGLALQASDRTEFERRVMDSLDGIQTSVPVDAMKFDNSLPHQVEDHYSDCLQGIKKEMNLLESRERSVRESSKQLIATKGDLEAEHRELDRTEGEIRGGIEGLQRRLREVTEDLEKSVRSRRENVEGELRRLMGDVQNSVSRLHASMDEKEVEVQTVIDQLIEGSR